MRLIRTHQIRLKWDGQKVTAFAEAEGLARGRLRADVPAALEDLARRIRIADVSCKTAAGQ